jgi:hypothetical protein
LLFACHATNATAQTIQDARFFNYWYNGGREKKLGITGQQDTKGPVTEAIEQVKNDASPSK